MSIDIKISPENLLPWSDFEDWENGASAAPTEHVLAGGSAAVAREATIIKKGTFSAKVTRSGDNATLSYDVPDFADYRGRKVTLGCWVRASVASRGRISIDDGVSSASNSSYHDGDSTFQFLTVTHNINPSATQIQVGFEVNTGNTAVYFDGAILAEGDTTFTVLTDIMDVAKIKPANKYKGQTFDVPRRIGARVPNMQIQSKTIEISGSVVGSTPVLTRTNLDSLLKVMNSQRRKPNGDREMRDLYIFEDRLLKVHVVGDSIDHRGAMNVRDIKLRLIAPDPFEQSTNKTRHSETISSSPTTFTISTVNGTTFSRPIITVTNNGSNISSLQVENLTSNQVWSYSGSLVTGQDLVIDTDLLTVENNGTGDMANFLGDSDMVLLPEDNEIKITGLVAGVIKFDFYNRFF